MIMQDYLGLVVATNISRTIVRRGTHFDVPLLLRIMK